MKPLKDIPREEAHRIFDAWLDGEPLTRHCPHDVTAKGFIALYASETYSIPVTYPEVPWHLIAEEWSWYAVDMDGTSGFFVDEPFVEDYEWYNEGNYIEARPIKINNGTYHWTETKVRRPE